MILQDFEYDGILLSSYGYMVCTFETPEDVLEIGNQISLNTVKPPRTNRNRIVSAEYEEPLTKMFHICKNPCKQHETDTFTDEEINQVVRWLNRKEYCVFKPIYDDGSFPDVFFKGTFNVSLIYMNSGVAGFELEFTADSPYGYQANKEFQYQNTQNFNIIDVSDEIGYQYVTANIKCLSAGNLEIRNNLDPLNPVMIENCSANEVITLQGVEKIISSSYAHQKLYNDFNYGFIRLCNTFTTRENIFTSSLPIDITIEYVPVRKVGIV